MNSALKGAFHCCRHVVPLMVEKNWGRIINISSYAGLHGYPGDTAYGAAKAGLIGFTKSLAKEVARKQITANVVIPGFLQTDMTAPLFATEDKIKSEIERIPLGRPGKLEEVAELVSFLPSRVRISQALFSWSTVGWECKRILFLEGGGQCR